MFDFSFMFMTMAVVYGLPIAVFIIWQWGNWIDDGSFWNIYEKGRYKSWYVSKFTRGLISYIVAALIFSILTGLTGYFV